jgi:Pyruvate/2-oxoacid:ferredoxin oxidoreductase delta subunit
MAKKDFECRICGCTEYETKTKETRMGGKMPIEYYYCKGCSVIFKDLKKFTK